MTATDRNMNSAHMRALAAVKRYDAKKKANQAVPANQSSIDEAKKMIVRAVVNDPQMYQAYMREIPQQLERLMQRYGIQRPKSAENAQGDINA